ncbi:hypothetical protein J7E38_18925 [Bacillus sp. ISL-35]|uniref:hypothetical protein n=1 Tax=Bacillus sp. ISL-35 TaxID=2819122 RepID=UPI001BE644B7|nr:hypothetical protein [Bacillus sp. ISL-35]MBT2681068.1 hypothetical protein [Bacillus sp. ISL-35]MBT2705388.1 hypothetical protein [Chryseobacterium sp. ISL-80]
MKENDLNLDIDIDRLKKDPSLNEVLNFTKAIFKKLPHETNGEESVYLKPHETNRINQESIYSLLTTAQSIINPATLSLLSNSLNQPENNSDKSEISSQAFDQLTSSMNAIKEELKQTKIELEEKSQRLAALESEVKSLKRRRRR